MKEIPELLEVLNECWEYFDNRSDADHDGYGFVPNAEMRLKCRCDEAIKIVDRMVRPISLHPSSPASEMESAS